MFCFETKPLVVFCFSGVWIIRKHLGTVYYATRDASLKQKEEDVHEYRHERGYRI